MHHLILNQNVFDVPILWDGRRSPPPWFIFVWFSHLALSLTLSAHLQVLGVHLNKWTLDRRLGLACLVMYAIFLCFSVLIEFNIFIFVNFPMCRDIH